jgi:hypothetical protein
VQSCETPVQPIEAEVLCQPVLELVFPLHQAILLEELLVTTYKGGKREG